MDKNSAISNARAFLKKKNTPHGKLIGANTADINGRTIWHVFFARRLPPNVKAVLPSTLIVMVHDETGDAETIRSP
jgi:hypothetical protein